MPSAAGSAGDAASAGAKAVAPRKPGRGAIAGGFFGRLCACGRQQQENTDAGAEVGDEPQPLADAQSIGHSPSLPSGGRVWAHLLIMKKL
jgi:hypothetical protein